MKTISQLRELLEYDPITGMFRWKQPTPRQARGWFRGNKSVRNYRRLYIDGRHYMAHAVAWAIVTGEWPREIDHKDRCQGNNVWTNLRLATHAENGRNRSLGKNSTTGVRGVSRFGGRYRATISRDGKLISLGIHDTIEAAAAVRRAAEKEHFGEFA